MPADRPPRLLVLLSGSIACYKACFAISRLVQAGVEVRAAVTPAALRFIGASTLKGLTSYPVFGDVWEPGRAMDHIGLARWADLALACPATASLVNRFAAGVADDAPTTLFLAWELQKKPWWIAPAMNTAMLEHPVTQASLQRLAALPGIRILGTASGSLACGETGPGRLLDPEHLVKDVLTHFALPTP